MGDAERRGIQSVEVGVRVLDVLAGFAAPQPLKTIADEVQLPASQVHRYLASYVRAGMVRQDERTGFYDLGPAALRIGLAALSRIDAHAIGQAALQELGAAIDRTCFLAVWSTSGPLIVNWYRSGRPLMTSLDIGSSLPVIGSATGHVFLAFNPPPFTAQIVATEMATDAKRTNAVAPDIATLGKRVRTAGFERIHETLIPGLHALSAPIRNHQGDCSIVLTVLLRANEADLEEPAILAALLRIAGSASAELGVSKN